MLWSGYAEHSNGFGEDQIFRIENVEGSNYGDHLVGDSAANVLKGLGGTDWLEGLAGADVLNGGDGIDWATYESAGSGVRVELAGGAANTGHAQGDTLINIENLHGSRFDDVLAGDGGANSIIGSLGRDSLSGLGGNDLLYAADGDIAADGGEGIDTVYFSSGTEGFAITLVADGNGTAVNSHGTITLSGVENVYGTSFADTMLGGAAANQLYGQAGEDTIDGGGGSDRLEGGANSDTFVFVHSAADTDQEQDTIWYYERGVDRIDLAQTQIDDWADLLNAGDGDYMEQVGASAVIHTTHQDTVTLMNVQMSTLTSADFVF